MEQLGEMLTDDIEAADGCRQVPPEIQAPADDLAVKTCVENRLGILGE